MKLPKVGRWKDMITYEYAVCEICGKKFQSVSTHIRHTHKITDIKEYKREYGYDIKQPLESGKLQETRRMNNLKTKGYENVLNHPENWIKKGQVLKDYHSEQTRERTRKLALDNNNDPVKLEKRKKTLKKTVQERMIRDSKGRFKKFI